MKSYDELVASMGSQAHVLSYWNELNESEKEQLAEQLSSLDVAVARECFEKSANIYTANPENLTPIPESHHAVLKNMDEATKQHYWNIGLGAISRGEVAALVLAGGQASRLGSASPKGTIPLGLDVAPEDSLLGIQAAKLALLERLAKKEFPGSEGKIQWVVMTSRTTEGPTKEHLDKVLPAAGLSQDQLTLFSQSEIPAFDMEGNFMLASKSRVVTSPNGNGGIYSALAPHLKELKSRGVKYFHVYCIDNILCKVADPHFIGYAIEKGADVVTKTVAKKPGELVGSVCLDNGKPRITEYTELGPELAGKTTEDGRLLFSAGSIANHLYTMDFLTSFCTPDFHLTYHRALKKIAHVTSNGELVKPEKPNGIKLEQFIFDVFEKSKNFHIWEVEREDEFSPLKNAESAGVDCLSTCQKALASQSLRWLLAAGAKVEKEPVYVEAKASYDGEGLDNYSGRVVSERVVV